MTGRPVRRASALAAGLLFVIVAVVGSAPVPSSAAPFEAPVLFAALSYSDGVRLYFRVPATIDGQPVVQLGASRSATNGRAGWNLQDARMYVDTGAEKATTYQYAVTASAAGGTLESKAVTLKVVGSRNDLRKFTSASAFVSRQYQAFLGRPPTASELVKALGSVGAGKTASNSSFLRSLLEDPSRAARQRVARLYIAYFKRPPDHGGLGYWSSQLQAGTKSIDDVSDSFARSNEFTRTYGTLSDIDFVTLVYENVLDRNPDSAGKDFWIDELDSGAALRGRVMTQFSESNEFRTTSRTRVQAGDLWDAMLGTNIPAAQYTDYVGHLDGGGNIGDLGLLILSLSAYHGDKS